MGEIINTYAIVKDGRVINLSNATQEFASNFDNWIQVNREDNIKKGDIYSNGVFTTPPPVKIVPESVTPRQVRLLLLQQNLLSSVEAMVAQQDEASRIAWEYASEYDRQNPLLLQLAANLNLTEDQLDDFFIEASKL